MAETINWAVFWATSFHPDKFTRCGEWRNTLDEAIEDYNSFREYEDCVGVRIIERVERFTVLMEEAITHV